MVVISYSGKEANAKIVYYGPGLGGKTTNLEFIYDSVPASSRGKMVSMKTQTDRTLFFDFLPLDLGELGGFRTRFLLYTVPGQVFYNATRKLVLRGADAVAFIADSQVGKMEENQESLANLEENLAEYDLALDSIPWVIQYNKRDVPEVYTIEELNKELNPKNVPYFEAVATEGTGVFETFRGLSRLLLEKLSEEIGHRMVISKSFGRRQAQEKETVALEEMLAAKVEPVREPEQVEPEQVEPEQVVHEKAEPDAIELASEVSAEASDVDLEELEILPEETGLKPSQEEPVTEAQVEPEPTIAHEHEILHGFFGETMQSTPLEKEIVREEIILSKESAPAAAPQIPAEEQITETAEQPEGRSSQEVNESGSEQASVRATTTERPKGQVDEPAVAGERPAEQVADWRPTEQTAEDWRSIEQEVAGEKEEEPSGTEAFFRQMVRRNNVGIFGKHEEEEAVAHPERSGSPEKSSASPDQRPESLEPLSSEQVGFDEVGTDVKSLEKIIEIPVSMLKSEKEIVITLRLRPKADVEKSEAPADEFMLDGISK